MVSRGEARLTRLARSCRTLGSLIILVTAAEVEITTTLNEYMPLSPLNLLVGLLAFVFWLGMLFFVVDIVSYFSLRRKTSLISDGSLI